MPQFSVVIPVWNRAADGKLKRCLDSVSIQTYTDFEVIVVDDGSRDDPAAIVADYDNRFKCIVLPKHKGRVITRNTGMEAATGTWIAQLDSDDCYTPMYLATFAYAIAQNPDAKLFVCGSIYSGLHKDKHGRHLVPKWTKIRPAWIPPLKKADDTSDVPGIYRHFNSGRVGTGMFIFARECLEKTGLMPNTWINHNKLADGISEWLGYDTGYNSATRLVGNPWGDDYALFRKLSIFYEVHSVGAALYLHYIR